MKSKNRKNGRSGEGSSRRERELREIGGFVRFRDFNPEQAMLKAQSEGRGKLITPAPNGATSRKRTGEIFSIDAIKREPTEDELSVIHEESCRRYNIDGQAVQRVIEQVRESDMYYNEYARVVAERK